MKSIDKAIRACDEDESMKKAKALLNEYESKKKNESERVRISGLAYKQYKKGILSEEAYNYFKKNATY